MPFCPAGATIVVYMSNSHASWQFFCVGSQSSTDQSQ